MNVLGIQSGPSKGQRKLAPGAGLVIRTQGGIVQLIRTITQWLLVMMTLVQQLDFFHSLFTVARHLKVNVTKDWILSIFMPQLNQSPSLNG